MTAVGADVSPSRQSTLINILTGDAIYITELVSTATIALVGAINIGTLLATRVAFTLINIITISAISSQLEACGTAAFVGPENVFTLVGT